jgi:3-oxoacyl-[acyl-carrier-protein] synthase III
VSSVDLAAPRAPIAPRRVPRTAGVLGLGCALPDQVVDNAAIAGRLGLPEGWIERRTGIAARRRLREGERLTDLAVVAARAALADAATTPGEVDLLLCATGSQDELMPNMAPLVAAALGAHRAGAMDVGQACTGFVSTLALAAGMVEAGRADCVVVVGADALSRFTDPDDKRTAAIFGDGAGAVVLSAHARGRLHPAVLGADGHRAEVLVLQRGGLIDMDGHATFQQAVRRLEEATREATIAAGLELEELDLLVYHQANRRILDALARALDVDPRRVVDAIGELGNTSAASVPLALEQARAQGRLRPGARVLLGAVGAGFTWGAAVLEWDPARSAA